MNNELGYNGHIIMIYPERDSAPDEARPRRRIVLVNYKGVYMRSHDF